MRIIFILLMLLSVPVLAFGATQVYYSVGQNTTDHMTGSPTVDISSGTATFSVAQTATNMGVGDKVTYNGATVAYISGKISTTQWTLITATGGTPPNVSGQTVNSIKHAFVSLSSALTSVGGAAYMNNSNLVTGNFQLNIPCYYDSGADSYAYNAKAEVTGFTTDSTHIIKIYTPYNTSTEVNQSQRHAGVWDDNKYRIEGTISVAAFWAPLYVTEDYVTIEGLQIKLTTSGTTTTYASAVYFNSANYLTLKNNILKGSIGGTNGAYGFRHYSAATIYIYNNIIYSFNPGRGLSLTNAGSTYYVYNNTLYKNATGVGTSASTTVLKNNLAAANTTVDFEKTGNYSAGSTHNASSDDSANYDAEMVNSRVNQSANFVFVDAALYDLHLSGSDAGAKGYGTTLSGDGTLPITTDIDNETRPASQWDIGADEVMVSASGTSSANGSTVKVAYNSTAQASTATVSGGAWTMTGMAEPVANDILTFWLDGVSDADESVYVARYGSGNITNVSLEQHVLSIGGATPLSVGNLAGYDYDNDNNIMHSANSDVLVVKGGNNYTDDTLKILAGTTYRVGSSEALTAHNIIINNNSSLDVFAGNPVYNISGNVINDGTISGAANVTLNGTGQSISGSGSTAFGDLTKIVSSGTDTLTIDDAATITISGALTLKGNDNQSANRLLLRSDSTGNQYDLNVASGGSYVLRYLDVRDCAASRTLDLDNSLYYNNNNTRITYDAKSMFF